MGIFTKDEQIIISHFTERQRRVFNSQKQRNSLRQAYNLALMCESEVPIDLEKPSDHVLDIPKVPTIEASARMEMCEQKLFTVKSIQDALLSQGVNTSKIYLNQITRKLQKEKLIEKRGKARHGRYQFEWVGGTPSVRELICFEEYAKQLKFFKAKELYTMIHQSFEDCTIGQCRVAIHAMQKKGVVVSIKKEGSSNVWWYKNSIAS